MSKPRWQRAVISAAGPAVNLVFPILLLTVYFVAIGVPYPVFEDKPVVVTPCLQTHRRRQAGLRAGDKVVAMNGEQQSELDAGGQRSSALPNPTAKLSVEVENAGERRTLEIPVQRKTSNNREQVLGFAPIKPVLEDVGAGMPAARAGLKEGDVIASVDGQPIQWWGQFTERVRGSEWQAVVARRRAQGTAIPHGCDATARQQRTRRTVYQIGVRSHEETAYRRVRFLERRAIRSDRKTYETIEDTIGVVGKLFSGRVSVRQLQSVVGISRAAGQAVHKGAQAVISLMVLISVNLGILNLLPIPILDGGNILLLAIEGGLRRDLSMAFKERFVQVGLVFLLVLFAIVMYNDLARLLGGHS